jgi:acetyltransferase-like isoleucine patch superfamily enzyme
MNLIKNLSLLYLYSRFTVLVRSYYYKFKFRIPATGLRIESIARIHGHKRIIIGKNFSAGKLFWLASISNFNSKLYKPIISIGNNVSMGDSVHIACINRVKICNNVLIGSRVLITDHSHGNPNDHALRSEIPPAKLDLYSKGGIVIHDNVWICDGVVITAGVIIGKGSIVAANSVVTKNVPSNCVVAGAPAVIISK